MQADIPFNPNPFLTQFFLSPEWVKVGREASEHVLGVWKAIVPKQSGALSRTGRVYSEIGGEAHDRIDFMVVTGEGTPRGGYGASHEYGIGIHPRSRVPPTIWMPQQPTDELVKALAIVNAMSQGPAAGQVSG